MSKSFKLSCWLILLHWLRRRSIFWSLWSFRLSLVAYLFLAFLFDTIFVTFRVAISLVVAPFLLRVIKINLFFRRFSILTWVVALERLILFQRFIDNRCSQLILISSLSSFLKFDFELLDKIPFVSLTFKIFDSVIYLFNKLKISYYVVNDRLELFLIVRHQLCHIIVSFIHLVPQGLDNRQ